MQHDDNLTSERPTFVTHLECSATGERYAADEIHNLSRVGKPLLVRYDLAGERTALTRQALADRPPDFWRYRELLPVRKAADVVSLGEAMTPLVRLPRIAAALGSDEVLVKDEGRLPTGSFSLPASSMARPGSIIVGHGTTRPGLDGSSARIRSASTPTITICTGTPPTHR